MAKRVINSSKKKSNGQKDPLINGLGGITTKIKSSLQRFSRFGWDILGVLLIAGGMIMLLGFLRITSGALISSLNQKFTDWFGFGRFILAIIFVIIGFFVVRWRKEPPETISLRQILAFEFAFFLLLAGLSIVGGNSLRQLEMGENPGGVVGWGVAEVFRALIGPTAGFVVIVLLFLISLFSALRILPWIEKYFRNQLQAMPASIPAAQQRDDISSQTQKAEAHDTTSKTKEDYKKPVWLPPEYRKSFNPTNLVDEKPDKPMERPIELPPMDILNKGETFVPDKRSINLTAGLIEKTLAEFGIPARVVGFRSGPTVTQFAVEPGYIDKSEDDRQKIRVSQISSLQRDLALALSAERLRIEAPVPGKSYVGIEIPNPNASSVALRPILESESFHRVNSQLALALGRDVSGHPVISDLATMPHLLIAGTTGSGKSVCITAITACLVMNNTPEDLKIAMIDPKRVELMRFNDMPHLMGSVETEIERILGVLRWATTEMDYRYKLLQKEGARNIDSYNKKMERKGKPKLPKIVILIDELSDLMISAPDETEHAIIRLAQKARAIGIHLIVATQRPSTDVVTGLIKANFSTRISFAVASSIDSRVILDTGGAETLLGKGDMLFLHPEVGLPQRAQGVIITDQELNKIIRWWKKNQNQGLNDDQPRYDDSESPPWEEKVGLNEEGDEDDVLIQDAIELIKREGHASASYFQRQLRVGYPRAARLVDQLEEMGVIGPSLGGGREREILIERDDETEE
jgi:S-DNA-T family DNA segregation ATPase FtsK/SpoIIIE